MNEEDICFMSAYEMADAIKRQEMSSSEITEVMIERIEKINPIIHAFCTLTFDLARKMAKKADEAAKRGEGGLLNGIPTSIKDLTMVKGVRTTFGSKLYENFIPDVNSVNADRLINAGIVLLGKTNTPEFGFKGCTNNLIFEETLNPWNLGRTTGGSSGGAVAAEVSGLCTLAQGSDGGGSIRIPSSLCGVYGFKSTYGLIPHYPQNYLFGEFLKHDGPITRYVKDATLMLDAMKGPHDGDKCSLPDLNINYTDIVDQKPKNLNIGYSTSLGYAKVMDPEVEKSVIDSVKKFETYGWNIEQAKVRMKSPQTTFYTLWAGMMAYDFGPKLDEWRDKMDPDLVKIIEAGKGFTGIGIMKALKTRNDFYEKFYQFFKKYDILITPTVSVPAFELGMMYPAKIDGRTVSPTAWSPFSSIFNLTGLPAASIPCGWSSDGLPIGMQIIGKRLNDATVLQVSKAFEEIAPWQDKKPKFN